MFRPNIDSSRFWHQPIEEKLGFSASPRKVGKVTVIDVRGRLTVFEGHALSELVADLLSQGQKKLLLNLQGVTDLDSSGIGTLVRSAVSAKRKGGELKILHRGARIRMMLEVTNLNAVLPAYSDEETAVASFASA